jgi:hypothetical protein
MPSRKGPTRFLDVYIYLFMFIAFITSFRWQIFAALPESGQVQYVAGAGETDKLRHRPDISIWRKPRMVQHRSEWQEHPGTTGTRVIVSK